MLVIVCVTLLVLAIAFFQAIQGIFSALITTVLAVLSAVIAFNYHEALAGALATTQPAYAHGVALIVLFVLPLLALRTLADWAIRGNVVLGSDMAGVWTERGLAGALGLITGMVSAGVLAVALQMLPFGQSAMGYRAFDGSLQRDQTMAPFYPDGFAVGMIEMLSAGALSGERDFSTNHDDFRLEAFCGRNDAGWDGWVGTRPDSITVKKVENFDRKTFTPPHGEPWWNMGASHPILTEGPGAGGRLLLVTVHVTTAAIDEDNRWRLVGTHFRLVSASGKSYYPLAGVIAGAVDGKGKELVTDKIKGKDSKGNTIYTSLLSRHFQPARRLEGEKRGQWDIARLALFAELPSPSNLAKAAGIKSGPKPAARAVIAEWIYSVPFGEKPEYMVFRRMVRAELPEISQ